MATERALSHEQAGKVWRYGGAEGRRNLRGYRSNGSSGCGDLSETKVACILLSEIDTRPV